MLLALPCGKDSDDVVKQSNNLTSGFIKYLQEKQAAGIVNIAAPGTSQQVSFLLYFCFKTEQDPVLFLLFLNHCHQ